MGVREALDIGYVRGQRRSPGMSTEVAQVLATYEKDDDRREQALMYALNCA